MDNRFEDIREIEKDLKQMDREEMLTFYNDHKNELFKIGIESEDRDERNGKIVEAYMSLSAEGRLTKDISGSDFLRIQEERFEALPKIDIKDAGLNGDSVSDRGVALYQEKMLSCDRSASPALACGLMNYLDKDENVRDMVDDKYAAFSVAAFIKTASPEEREFMIPKTAEESRDYVESPMVMDGRFDKVARAFTGDANVNMEMMDRLSDATREISGKDNPTVAVLGDKNGLLGYELKQNGADVISADKFGNDYNPDLGIADCRYTDVRPLDYAEAAREFGDRDFIIVSAQSYGESPLADIANELREINEDAKIIYIGPEAGEIEGLKSVDCISIQEVDLAHISYPGEDSSVQMFEIDKKSA